MAGTARNQGGDVVAGGRPKIPEGRWERGSSAPFARLPEAMQHAELVAVRIAQIGEVELRFAHVADAGGSSQVVAPLAMPVACHASASSCDLARKPIVPPLAGVAGLPSIGLDTENVPLLVR